MEKLARTWKMWVFVKLDDRFVLIILFLIVQCYCRLCYGFPFVYKSTASLIPETLTASAAYQIFTHALCTTVNRHLRTQILPHANFLLESLASERGLLDWVEMWMRWNTFLHWLSYEIFLIFLFPIIQLIWSCLHYAGATSLYPMNIRRWKKLFRVNPRSITIPKQTFRAEAQLIVRVYLTAFCYLYHPKAVLALSRYTPVSTRMRCY